MINSSRCRLSSMQHGSWGAKFLWSERWRGWRQVVDVVGVVAASLPKSRWNEVAWELEVSVSGKYTTKSLHRYLTFKVQIRSFYGWSTTTEFSVVYYWKGGIGLLLFCVKLVGKVRQLIRLCSNAPVASFLWTYFRSMLGWSLSPTSMERLFVDLLDHLKKKLRSISF